ncbi:hypothetical protein GR7B_00240 [Vibrio phage vB_VcorM_GR7B]|nr:hypothetical protein GR7B_00240 [Vibrio phage vB_VcorM_GR7B]
MLKWIEGRMDRIVAEAWLESCAELLEGTWEALGNWGVVDESTRAVRAQLLKFKDDGAIDGYVVTSEDSYIGWSGVMGSPWGGVEGWLIYTWRGIWGDSTRDMVLPYRVRYIDVSIRVRDCMEPVTKRIELRRYIS